MRKKVMRELTSRGRKIEINSYNLKDRTKVSENEPMYLNPIVTKMWAEKLKPKTI